MENDKYYTPDISELYVGYELEGKVFNNSELDSTEDIWIKVTINSPDFSSICDLSIDGTYFLNKDTHRVKYLDSFDIISLGFEYIECFDSYQKNNMSIWFKKFKNQDCVVISFGEFSTLYFERKSINELKTILKWIK